jgi:hypothetical protein
VQTGEAFLQKVLVKTLHKVATKYKTVKAWENLSILKGEGIIRNLHFIEKFVQSW